MEWFQIDWHGPFPIETAHEHDESKHFGIYSIWEKSAKGIKLIYIGETYSQSFSKRLQQHKKEWLYRTENKKVIHFGIIKMGEGRKINQDKIFDIEASFINAYIPPYNTVSKKGYYGRDTLIINTGKKGELSSFVGEAELIVLIKKCLK